MEAGLQMKGIVKNFSEKKVLQGIDLHIERGSVHAIVGENGAGKSTLMNILSGALESTSGEIYIDGVKKVFHGPQDAASNGIGMVYQHFMLIPTLSAWQNIVLGMEPINRGYRVDKGTALKLIKDAAAQYGVDIDPDQLVGTMTVGEQQNVEILKVMIRNAQYIILDEPTAVLTPQETQKLCNNILRLKESGKSIIFISHKLEEVMGIADNITVLRTGKLIGTLHKNEATPDLLIKMMVGREVDLSGEPASSEKGDTILKLRDVSTKRTRFSPGLQKISFDLRKGEVLGIAGVDGNGQSELLDAILGMIPVSEGQIVKNQADLTKMSSSQIRADHVALIPPDRHQQGLVLNSSVLMNSTLGCESDKRFCHRGILKRYQLRKVIPELLDAYDVRMPSIDAMVSSLSGGNQQKLILAREFSLRDPALILAANPTRGLDIGAMETVYEELEKKKKAGSAILLISTELTEILRLSDRIGVFYKGRCVGIVPRENATVDLLGRMMMGLEEREVKHEKNCE